jgi:hypothetical protein
MSKHTPGPWQYSTKITASENHRGFSIRAARWSISDVQPIDVEGEEGEANARLIAAAPDLLEACRAVSAHYSASLDYQPAFVTLARAALAKATGEDA